MTYRLDSDLPIPYVTPDMFDQPVHSYGRIGHNRDLANDVGRVSKLATISNYRFTAAFENSITPDYVTEKLFHPLMVGSVPIYRGAPNVESFAPAATATSTRPISAAPWNSPSS